MRAAVEVIIDRDDDVATVRAIRALADREPGTLVISIVPGLRSDTEVVWAILRALGKRSDQLQRSSGKVWWIDAERWLTAHRINEIVVLCAQHLGDELTKDLKEHVGWRLGIGLTLIYGGPARFPREATTSLDACLTKDRHRPPEHSRPPPWPQVPRSHPLRLRYDCWRQLTPDEFARVEQLLHGSMRKLGGWSMEWCSLAEIETTSRLVSAADDPDEAYIRRCGAELGLLGNQVPIRPTSPLALHPHVPTGTEIDAIHAYTDPATAGYQLAKLITGLSDEMLRLLGGDQITDEAIIGCPVPNAARAILRALDDEREPVLAVPYGAWPPPSEDEVTEEEVSDEPSRDERQFAAALGRLLRGRSERVPAIKLSRTVRSRFEALRADGTLDRRYCV